MDSIIIIYTLIKKVSHYMKYGYNVWGHGAAKSE